MIPLLLALAFLSASGHDAATVMARIMDPNGPVIVVAHRGCHEAAPVHGLSDAPENSLLALEHCVEIGVDVMETDVRMTRDGYLVMLHDPTVDRTTDGTGNLSDLTLAQVKALRLRANEGGPDAPLTDQTIPTLDEMLARAGNRIVLNLDIKDAVHAETIAAVERAGAAHRVLVKATAGAGSAPLAAIAPYDRVAFLPMLSSADATARDLPAVIATQSGGSRRPVGFEVPHMPVAALTGMVLAARKAGGRLWANTLWDGYVAGVGGDADALKDPDAVWGRLVRAGVTILQTDRPEALRRYLDR